MDHDWKTLSAVAFGAALVGWLMVRLLTGGSAGRIPNRPAVAVASPAAASPATARAPEQAPTAPRLSPRATVGPAETGTEPDVDLDAIVRDLDVLSQALVRDQRIEDRLLPRINDALDVPGVMTYRRAPDFWEPAIAGSEGANR